MRKLVNAFDRQQSDAHKSRFQALWEQASTTAAEIEALTTDLDNLVARIESEIAPVERKVAVLIRQVLERQLDFSTRKTLRKWQRIELEHRIAELVCDLVSMDLLEPDLHERLALRLAVAGGFQQTPNSVLSIEAQVECFLALEFADAAQCWWTAADPQCMHESTAPACLDDSVFKRLFRQAAAALHPDRETDPDKRTEKHALMVQLLRARDEQDLITLLQLHERHAEAESSLSGADESQLETVLQGHLDVLRVRRESIIFQSHQHFMAYQRFYDSIPAEMDNRIACYIESLTDRQPPLCSFINEVRTLKALQEFLTQPDTWHSVRVAIRKIR